MKTLALAGIPLFLAAAGPAWTADADPYLYLEERESEKSLAWVRERNDRTVPAFKADARYAGIEKEVRKIVLATDRIPSPAYSGGYVYNFWQDKSHVRGIWRRATLVEYAKSEPAWELLLDLDELAKNEKENWVWKGSSCLPPEGRKCLLNLSRGGGDAVVVREYDLAGKVFPEKGFVVPEAKSDVAWYDEERVLVGTDFGPGSLTDSGYPRIVKLWKRGTPLADARTVFEGKTSDVSAWGLTHFAAGRTVALVGRSPDFFTNEMHLVEPSDFSLKALALPLDTQLQGFYRDNLLVQPRSEWKPEGAEAIPAGALAAVPLGGATTRPKPGIIYAPGPRATVSEIQITRGAVYVALLDNVQGQVLRYTQERDGGPWRQVRVGFPDAGTISFLPTDDEDDLLLATYQGFLSPPTVYQGRPGKDAQVELTVLRKIPDRFDGSRFEVLQYESSSRDGTRVPYFVVQAKGLKREGENPTLLYGYGGFEISLDPYYLNSTGKVWLEGGGVYVVANIRGGGEFGPKWHQAALLENRQRAYDDFISVAEDLIARKITSPRRLGIEGGSNGGLLVGAVMVQRPELFSAVVCQVPLLDMMRYHLLPPGASWMAEYGNPEDPVLGPVIAKYSPYQNIKKGVRYPKIFLITSTKDDRVHPGHARKMAARLEEHGNAIEYYENTEGGHSGAANLEQRIENASLEFTYLFRQLF